VIAISIADPDRAIGNQRLPDHAITRRPRMHYDARMGESGRAAFANR
jgi:hypothetical protein